MFVDREKITINSFLNFAVLRYEDNVYHHILKKSDQKNLYTLIQKAEGINLFVGYYEKRKNFKVLMLTADVNLIKSDWEVKKHLEDPNHIFYFIHSTIDKPNFHDLLIDYYYSNKITLTYSFLEISENIQESQNNDKIQIANYYSAGYPPLLIVENGNYHLPLRGGIPLGIVNFIPKKQTLEIPLKAKIFVHTPINEKIHNIREFHYDIAKNNLDKIPQDILLFEFYYSGHA